MPLGLTPEKLLKMIAYIVLLMFLGTVLTISLFPIYPDEVAIRYGLSRLIEDFPFKSTATPFCSSTMLKKFEWFQYFPAAVNWLLHGLISSPISLRGVGVLIAAADFFMIYKLFIKTIKFPLIKSKNSHYLIISLGFIFAILGLGNFPIFLALNRNEQLIILTLLSLLLLNNAVSKEKGGAIIIFLYAIAYFGIVQLMLYSHAKSLFLAPFLILIAVRLSEKINSRLLKILFFTIFLIILFSFYNYWKNAYLCIEKNSLDVLHKSYSLDPTLLYKDPYKFLVEGIKSFVKNINYVDHLIFSEVYEVNYLPAKKLIFFEILINLLLTIFFYIVFLFEIIYLSYLNIKKLSSNSLLLIILLISATIGSIFNLPKHWYDADYYYFILAIILILLIAENFFTLLHSKILIFATILLFTLSIASQALFMKRNFYVFLTGFEGPNLSLTKFYSSQKNDVDVLYRLKTKCGLDQKNRKHIFVDDFTYWSVKETKWPIPITYLWIDTNQEELNSLFRRFHSDGVLTRCNSLLYNLGSPVIREGEFCCISKENLIN